MAAELLRLGAYEYAHLTNDDTNITELVVGPMVYALASHESVARPPTRFVVVPATKYCLVRNPHCICVDSDTGCSQPLRDADGQVKVRFGETEYRWHVEPFPLYPDEEVLEIEDLKTLSSHTALQIEVLTSYYVEGRGSSDEETTSRHRRAGERYLFRGPGTYYPRVEERVEREVLAYTVERGTALWCTTSETFTDKATGEQHFTGDRYMRLSEGMHFLQPSESLQCVETGTVLSIEDGLHVRPTRTYADPRSPYREKGVIRREHEVFLVTGDQCACFIAHPYDEVVRSVRRIFVSATQYAVVRSPLGTDSSTGGESRRVRTNISFFLKPGERLDGDRPRDAYRLSAQEAVLVVALGSFNDTACSPPVSRFDGERWLVRGPCSFIPTDLTAVVPDKGTGEEVRRTYVLGEGHGLYVRNMYTGVVRCVSGPCSYMLGAEEELWEKPFSAPVERLLERLVSHTAYIELERERDRKVLRGRTVKALSYCIPHNSITQLYNYATRKTRIIFGPDRVLVEPDEEPTVISLSGSVWDPAKPTKCMPKQPHHITALHLFLGPSNMSDVVHVETRDHAQLALQMCYDWYFDVPPGNAEAAKACFSTNDFVGDACSFIASRIRAAVASMPFEEFHKNSAQRLRNAVFGADPSTGVPNKLLRFAANHLVITSVDTQEVEVLDERTRQGLQRSVKMALDITILAQEAEAQQVTVTREQEARGRLDRQRMRDQVAIEEQRNILLNAESNGLAIISSGKSKAWAEAFSAAARIESEAAGVAATLRASKEGLLHRTTSEMLHRKRQMLADQEAKVTALTLQYEKELQTVRQTLAAAVIAALGSDTIAEMAKAGPAFRAELFTHLGLEGDVA